VHRRRRPLLRMGGRIAIGSNRGTNVGNGNTGNKEVRIEVSYLGMAAWIHQVTEPAVRSAIRALQLSAASRGLDAGCGIGNHTFWLAEAVSPGGHVTGVDISRDCLSRAEKTANRSALAKQVSFQYGDMNDLPFDDDTFDWVWSADTLWPVGGKNPLPLVKELARVAKPGGTIAILFWSSQKLLPGHPLLEARLNATCAANFPYTDDTKPRLHILRSLGWLHEALLEVPKVRTFVADVHAPLDDASRKALTATFQMLWEKAEQEVTARDWAEFHRLCHAESPEFILDLPDYYAFITYSLFYGRVANQPLK
jgi:ubiquinone/menaquinone biosynthesis C-methylase UbiE